MKSAKTASTCPGVAVGSYLSLSHHVLTRCNWIKLQAIKAISSLLIWTSKPQWGILFCFILLPPTVRFLWPAPYNSALNIKYLLIGWSCSSLMYSTDIIFSILEAGIIGIHQVYPSASIIICWGNVPAINSKTERATVITVLSCTQPVTVRGCPVSLVRSWGNQWALTFWPELSVSILEAFGHCTWLRTGQHFDCCQQFFMHQVHVAAFFLIGLAKQTSLLLLLCHISLYTTKLQHITHPTLFVCFHGLFVLELNYSCIISSYFSTFLS